MSAYTILGLSENATEDQVTRAYRKLAMKHHPDRGGDEEKFKAMKAAYEEIEARGFRPPPKAPPAPPPRPNPNSPFNKKPAWESPKTPGGTWRDAKETVDSQFESIDELLEKMKRARATPGPKNVWAEPKTRDELTANVRIREAFTGFRFDLPGTLNLSSPYVMIPPGIPDGHRGKYQTSDGQTKTILVNIHMPDGYHLRGFDGSDNLFSAGLNVGDVELDYECDAIDLIIGAWVTVKDFLGEELGVRIPPGFNPLHRLKIAGKGYFGWLQEYSRPSNRRMDMYLKVRPIFNKPADIERQKIINLYNSIDPDARI